jgi:hypothetical protein
MSNHEDTTMSSKTASTFNENAFSGLLHAGTHGTFMRLPAMPANAKKLKEAKSPRRSWLSGACASAGPHEL